MNKLLWVDALGMIERARLAHPAFHRLYGDLCDRFNVLRKFRPAPRGLSRLWSLFASGRVLTSFGRTSR